MPSGFYSVDGDGQSMKGKVVISKTALVVGIIFAFVVIVAVGLIAGLTGSARAGKTNEVDQLTTIGVITATTTSVQVTTPASPIPSGPWRNIRLPASLIPMHYAVDLQPNLVPISGSIPHGYFVFNGTSSVEFMVNETTSYIVIHSNKLNYTEVQVTDFDGNVVPSTYFLYEENQYLVVNATQNMVAQSNYTLHTEFIGELGTDLGGLYRSTYVDKDGTQKVIALTQMEPTDARKAFPCFDEPALKAIFDVYLWHEPPNFALSNMPNVSTEAMHDNWMRTKFETTVKMSTYLLAFVVCDFDYVETFTDTNVQTRIYARPREIINENGNYAKDITPVILDYYAEFFNVTYPLPKSDQIAVTDFAAGAMENWGLVIYRETALLYNKMVNSASNKQRVAAVIAHELAHQWFGNLISPLWWDELWLNEGFARYVQYIGMGQVEPTWRMNDQFVVIDLQRAMNVDGLTSSRPIVAQDVNTPADINALFDTISYSKGACILRMINEFTGETAFKLGLKNYLDEYAYGPVEHIQLFEFWEKAVAETGGETPPGGFVSSMDTWMLQMGYPTIKMMRRGTSNTVEITQERFLLDPKASKTEPSSPYNYQWVVPLWYTKQSDNSVKSFKWIERNLASPLEISVPSDEYFIGNYEAFGFYRVNYDEENWNRIITQLNTDFSAIDVRSRGQLIIDAFNLARREDINYAIPLSLTKFLLKDFDYIPWESALDSLSYFDLVLGRSPVFGVYLEYLTNLVQPLYDNVTWDDTGEHLVQYQRINAIRAACFYNHPDCVTTAQGQFREWVKTSVNNITPNLRTTVYCNAIRYGGAEEWDFTWEMYQNETNSQEKAKLEYALSCSRTPWIIQRFLDIALNEEYVRKQNAPSIIQDLCDNEYARDITWDFVRREWDYIYDVYGIGLVLLRKIINKCTSHFSTEFELQELVSFKETNSDKLGSGVRSMNQAIEKTKTNIQWREDNEEEVSQWLTTEVAVMNSNP